MSTYSKSREEAMGTTTPETKEETVDYQRLFDAVIAVAADPPDRHHGPDTWLDGDGFTVDDADAPWDFPDDPNVNTDHEDTFAAKVSWTKITELREALDACNIEWR